MPPSSLKHTLTTTLVGGMLLATTGCSTPAPGLGAGIGATILLYLLIPKDAPSSPPSALPLAATVSVTEKQRMALGVQGLEALSTKVKAAVTQKKKVEQQLTRVYYTINTYKSAISRSDSSSLASLRIEYTQELDSLKRTLKQLENNLQEAQNAKEVVEKYYTIVTTPPLAPSPAESKPPLSVSPALMKVLQSDTGPLGDKTPDISEPLLQQVQTDTTGLPDLPPAAEPAAMPTVMPSVVPTACTGALTCAPTIAPTAQPTPTAQASLEPAATPTPTPEPTPQPTIAPTPTPSADLAPVSPPSIPGGDAINQLETVAPELEKVTEEQQQAAQAAGVSTSDIPPAFELILADNVDLEVGASADLFLKTSGPAPTSDSIVWQNSDPGVIELQGSGNQIRLIGLKTGTATITVKVGSSQRSATVVVTGAIPTPAPTSTQLPPPTITSLSATTGTPGKSITILGTGFDPTAGNNTVKFGDLQATVTSASATELVVTVPNASAGSYNLSVTVSGTTNEGNYPFVLQDNTTTVTPFIMKNFEYLPDSLQNASQSPPIAITTIRPEFLPEDFPASLLVAFPLAGAFYITASGNILFLNLDTDEVTDNPAKVNKEKLFPAWGGSYYSTWGLYIDAKGILYTVDHYRARVSSYALPTRDGSVPEGFIRLDLDYDNYADAKGGSIVINGQTVYRPFSHPTGVVADSRGFVFVTANSSEVFKIDPRANYRMYEGITNVAGKKNGFKELSGITIDSQDNLYVVDKGNHIIHKIDPTGKVTALAGSTQGNADGQGLSAQFSSPAAITIDAKGNLYVVDSGNHSIRKIDTSGNVTTFAGYTPNADALAVYANISRPSGGITIDAQGNLYVIAPDILGILKLTPPSP